MDIKEARYPRSVIRDFVSRQRNLEQSPRLRACEVAEHPFFKDLTSYPGGRIDLMFSFTDGEPQPALCFLWVPPTEEEEENEVYLLRWIDPSIEPAWKNDVLPLVAGQPKED